MVGNLVTSLAAAGAPERVICRTCRAEMEADAVTSKSRREGAGNHVVLTVVQLMSLDLTKS